MTARSTPPIQCVLTVHCSASNVQCSMFMLSRRRRRRRRHTQACALSVRFKVQCVHLYRTLTVQVRVRRSRVIIIISFSIKWKLTYGMHFHRNATMRSYSYSSFENKYYYSSLWFMGPSALCASVSLSLSHRRTRTACRARHTSSLFEWCL